MSKGEIQTATINNNIDKIISLIESAKSKAIAKVNEELILLYFNIGKILSEAKKDKGYGDKFIDNVETIISKQHPDLKGFTRRGRYRMVQFYEAYFDDKIVSTLLTQLS